MGQKIQTVDQARLREVGRLYKNGLKLREIGEHLKPPVGPPRVVQLLQQGQERGLYGDLRAERRAGMHLTEERVRTAVLAARKRGRVSGKLRVSPEVLEARFGGVIDSMYVDRRGGRAFPKQREPDGKDPRVRAIDDYLAAARELGRNPTMRDLRGTGLARRIYLYFGAFAAFLEAAGVRPDYAKPACRERGLRAQCATRDAVETNHESSL